MDHFNFDKFLSPEVRASGMRGGPLSEQEQWEIVRQVEGVFSSWDGDESMGIVVEGADEDGHEQDMRMRTAKLNELLQKLWSLWMESSNHVEAVTEKLADGSRDPKWRKPIGDAGILGFYLEIFKTQTLENSTKIQIMRLIGNTCADTDENRARLVASNALPQVIAQLHDTSLLAFAIPVLYNICIDYEPAQKQASENKLTKEIIELLSGPRRNDAVSFIGYICKLLDLMVAQEPDHTSAPENTAYILLQNALNESVATDLEDFLALVTTAIHYLGQERFQQALVNLGGIEITLGILTHSFSRFDLQLLDSDDGAALTQMRSAFNQVLADISALPNFRETVLTTSSSTVDTLRRWLISPHLQLQVCACIILGNIARSDSVCEKMVQELKIHQSLISIIKTANDSQLLHSAIGFLKNLALPLSNKAILGEAGLFDILPRLWNMDVLQQIQFSAVSLTRQLVQNTYENVRFLGMPLSEDADSPSSSKTRLSILIELFDRTDVEPIKMEISRTIAGMCRVWNSIPQPNKFDLSPETLARMRVNFFNRHREIDRPLAFMIAQTKWPVVSSEGWFVFALMARFPEGAECVSHIMQDVKVFRVLVQLMTGRSVAEYNSLPSLNVGSQTTSPESAGGLSLPDGEADKAQTSSTNSLVPNLQAPDASGQANELQRIDRMNALVLLSEILKNMGNKMALLKRATFEDLIQRGGGIVASYTEEERTGGDLVDGKSKCNPHQLSAGGKGLAELTRESSAEFM